MSRPEKWKRGILNDLVTLQRGHDLTSYQQEFGKIPVIGSYGVIGYHNIPKSRGPGVTVGRSGSIGEVQYIKSDYWPHNTCLYSINFHGNEPRYVYYFLKTINLSSFNAGSAVPTLNRNHIHTIPIDIPPLDIQKKITKILSSLDDEIEILKDQNQILEKIIQSIFKSWFIDFEFPNEKGKPYKSSGGEMIDSELGKIPKGWKAGNLGEICDFVMGQSPPGSSYNEFGEGVVFYQGVRDFGEFFPSPRVYCIMPKKFALAKDVLFSVRAPIASINVADQKCCIGRGLAALHLKENHGPFLYYLLKSNYHQWQSFEAKGTVFGAVTRNDINDFKIIVPSLDAINSFNLLTNPLYDKIWNDNLLIHILTEVRDSLLPKLMSGEIRV